MTKAAAQTSSEKTSFMNPRKAPTSTEIRIVPNIA